MSETPPIHVPIEFKDDAGEAWQATVDLLTGFTVEIETEEGEQMVCQLQYVNHASDHWNQVIVKVQNGDGYVLRDVRVNKLVVR